MLMQTLWPLAQKETLTLSRFPYNLTSQNYVKPTLSNVVDVDIVFDRDFGHILNCYLCDLRGGGLYVWNSLDR